jgi:VWFA-related protein
MSDPPAPRVRSIAVNARPSLVGLLLLTGIAVQAVAAEVQQQPVFRTTVDRVRVDVVVTDGSDKPITALTKTDFSIIENGKPQAITDFRFISVPVAQRAADVSVPRRAPPDVATNAMPSPASRLWAIIVDDLHLIEADIVPIKRTLADIVRALPPDDEVALVYTGRSDISLNFTTDLGQLLTAIDHVRDAVGFGLDAYPELTRVDPRYILRQATIASDAMRNVASSLAGSGHPRRALIYIGTMTTINPQSAGGAQFLADELQRTFDQAKRSDVPIYTIDPRGTVLAEDAVRGGIGVITSESIRGRISANIRHQQEWLHDIAINTGGRAFTNSSDLTKVVRDIMEENGSFYELAYSPDPLVRDGKFHEFSVKVNRPGVRVRARYGYVAPGARPDAPSLQQTIDAAMSAGVNVAGLTLRAAAAPLGVSAKGVNTAITVEVSYPSPADGSRRIDDTLALTVYAIDADAKVKARSSRQLRFAGTAPSDQPVTLLIDDLIELPPQPITLRIGLASQQLGRAGTVQMAVDVPKPADSRLQLGGIAIGVAGVAAPALNAAAIKSTVPFQPTTARVFAATDSLRVFGRAFWRSKDAAVVTVGIKAIPASLKQPALVTSPGISGGQDAAFDATVPLAGLAPGRYVLEIAARLGSGKPVTREVPLTVR